MYADVLVEIPSKKIDNTFTYLIPSHLKDKIQVGIRVKVSFGKQVLEGFVLKIYDNYASKYELKEILELVDEKPILNEEMLMLGEEIAKTTLCSKISAYQVMLPKALKAKIKNKSNIKQVKVISLAKSNEEIKDYLLKCRYPKQKQLLEKLIEDDEIVINNLDSCITTLLKHGLIKLSLKEDYRYLAHASGNYHKVVLNNDQQKVVDTITSNLNKSDTYLLYGVTGSGKTEVYMEIIKEVINQGKTAIMLVPEISLTPQITDRFLTLFGNNIALLHSGLSDSEKYDEYRKIMRKEVKIVIGARSAIFAPLLDIGVIIIDEEHSTSYKQDNHPRYNAKDVALLRSKYHNCPLILGSATPTLESFAKAGNHVYQLLTLPKRANNNPLPLVTLVDMKKETEKGNYVLSSLLKEKIANTLAKDEQIILLLNRRGYSSMLTCPLCGNVVKCPRCDISLTYHKTSDMLRCHYCGYNRKKPQKCDKCGSEDLKDYGLGTQKLEEIIKNTFNCRVVRMDVDTTYQKGAHEKIISDFAQHKYDILLGTQMIAKGLDFPLVTLVGVINADTTLMIPDYRSSERTFELLSQISGRAGRSNRPGEVIIQTFNNEHYSIKYAKQHDYLSFYKEEMKIRKILKYSPYYYIILVSIASKNYEKGFKEATKIGDYLRKNVSNDTIILGPTMANMFKINNIYHFQCIIKYRYDDILKDTLIKIDERYKEERDIDVYIDIDPIKI